VAGDEAQRRRGRHPAVRLRRSRLLLAALLEPLVLLASQLAPLAGREPSAVAARLRGALLGGARARLRVGRHVAFVGPPRRFLLGHGVTLHGRCYLDANGAAGEVVIGEGTHVDQNGVLYGQGGLRIGADCAIAAGFIVYSQTNADALADGTPVAHQPTAYLPVEIGDGCWLGAGVRVLPGVRIGDGVHVGAGAVVNHDLEPFTVAVGVPARAVRHRLTEAPPVER
jgi:acetyltransferase-like isoleucine patch superfamily enzyme